MPNKGKRKVKTINVIDVIPGSGGIINTIAESLGVSWHTAERAIKESPEATEMLQAELEKRLDLAEGVIVMNIQMSAKQQRKGYFADTSDAKWYLSKKGKGRSYSDKLELEHSGSVTWKEFINAGDTDTEADRK